MPDPEQEPDEQQPEESPVIRNLREQAKEGEAAKLDAAEARRELTLHKAGLGTLSDKQQKALTAAHEGDWEPEALKATATELGFVQTQEQQEQSQAKGLDPAQEAAMRRVQSASNGETQPSPPSNDQERAAAYAAAESPEQLKAMLRDAGQLAE